MKTTLAPDIVAAILDENMSRDVTLFDLAVDPPGAVGGAAKPNWWHVASNIH